AGGCRRVPFPTSCTSGLLPLPRPRNRQDLLTTGQTRSAELRFSYCPPARIIPFSSAALECRNDWCPSASCATVQSAGRIVASLDRKRLGQILGARGMTIRGVSDEAPRRNALAFAADAWR